MEDPPLHAPEPGAPTRQAALQRIELDAMAGMAISNLTALAIIMLLSVKEHVVGKFTVRGWLKGLGWLATAVMTLAASAMLATKF